MKKIIAIGGFLFATFTVMGQGEISVTVEKVKSDKGDVYVNLYSSDDGFPSEWSKAFRQEKMKAEKGDLKFSFKDLPFGFYAISVGHDENGNGDLDSNFIGFPKEPVGASNQTSFGKPNFNRSKFELNQSNMKEELKIQFLNE